MREKQLNELDEFNYEQSASYKETLRQAAAAALARIAVACPAMVAGAAVDALYKAIVQPSKHKLNASTRWISAIALEANHNIRPPHTPLTTPAFSTPPRIPGKNGHLSSEMAIQAQLFAKNPKPLIQ